MSAEKAKDDFIPYDSEAPAPEEMWNAIKNFCVSKDKIIKEKEVRGELTEDDIISYQAIMTSILIALSSIKGAMLYNKRIKGDHSDQITNEDIVSQKVHLTRLYNQLVQDVHIEKPSPHPLTWIAALKAERQENEREQSR